MSAAKTRFSCGDALDIRHAEALHRRLTGALQRASTIELHADKVERVDTAGLQLLLALSEEVRRCGGKIIWKKTSAPLLDAVRLGGLSEALQLQ